MKMKRSFKWIRGFQIVILSFALLSLSGCWSASEINNLAIVNVMAIDQSDNGQVEITAVIIKPNTTFSGPGAGSIRSPEKQRKSLIETTKGKSLYKAISKLSSAVPEFLYFGHLDVIVFGERAARENMTSYLDFFKRQNDFRPNIKLLVTKGPARKLVQTKPKMNTTIGLEIKNLAKSNRFDTTNMVKDVSQFMEATLSNTSDPYTGVIQPAKTLGIHMAQKKNTKGQKKPGRKGEKKVKGASGKPQRDRPKALSLRGTAVFKGGQLRGYLDEKETRGMLAIKGELDNGVVVLDCGDNDKGTVSLNIKNSDSKLSPKLSGGDPMMDVKIHVKAEIGDITCSGLNVNSVTIDRFNQKLANLIKRNATDVLNKVKNQWQADIFGFGEAIYKKAPEKWDQLAPQWRNGQFKKMNVH
ncbi:MAG TPA: Ger(x)C family spore germination protein, partial [Bacillales bacterium]